MIGKYYKFKELRLIVGSGGITQKGFLSTDIDTLDITNWWHWFRNFKLNSIDFILAEHVFEHLDLTQINRSLLYIHWFLQKGGTLRIAVPDRNRKDYNYQKAVRPPADDHKTLLNINDFRHILQKKHFKVIAREYFTNDGKFIHTKWSDKDGRVSRSFLHDRQKEFKMNNHFYTSLIIDAIKI